MISATDIVLFGGVFFVFLHWSGFGFFFLNAIFLVILGVWPFFSPQDDDLVDFKSYSMQIVL